MRHVIRSSLTKKALVYNCTLLLAKLMRLFDSPTSDILKKIQEFSEIARVDEEMETEEIRQVYDKILSYYIEVTEIINKGRKDV